MEFSEFLTYKDFLNDTFRLTTLNTYIQRFFTNPDKLNARLRQPTHDPDRKPAKRDAWHLTKLYRFEFTT